MAFPRLLLIELNPKNSVDQGSLASIVSLESVALKADWSRMKYTRKRLIKPLKITILVAGVAILLSSCGSDKKEVNAASLTSAPAVSVVVAPVVQKTVPVYTELTARTDATSSVDIRARVKAFLLTQSYEEGTEVKTGQVLFTLDKREYEAQLMQANAQLARAQADLAQAQDKTVVDTAEANVQIALAGLNKADTDVRRLKPLAEQRAVPQQDYDNATAAQQAARADVEGRRASLNTAKVNQTASIQQAKAAVEAANASIRTAQLNVDFCTITSPIDGIAGTRQVTPGNLVGNGEATLLTTVSNVNPMRVYVSISESDYLMYQRLKAEGKLKDRGGELDLILADGSMFPEKGRIIIADRAVDLKTGTFSLVAEFPNPNAILRPGQFGRVRLAATVVQNALLVPQKAVTELQSAQVVYVVGQDNKVALRTVTLGDRVGQDYIVTEGVKAGERIIVEGIQKARPGATVTPTTQAASAEASAGQAK
jgi:membrane fusion protein, multidrug efflux system